MRRLEFYSRRQLVLVLELAKKRRVKGITLEVLAELLPCNEKKRFTNVLQDEATKAESQSGLPMFGTKFPR